MAGAEDDDDDDAPSSDEDCSLIQHQTRNAKRSAFLKFDDDSASDSSSSNDDATDDSKEPVVVRAPQRPSKQPAGNAKQQRKVAAAAAAAVATMEDLLLRAALPPPAVSVTNRSLDSLLLVAKRHLNIALEAQRELGLLVGNMTMSPAGRTRRVHVTVSPLPSWISPPTRAGGGFSMTHDRATSLFQLELSREYTEQQERYEAIESTGDPQLLIDFVMAVCPFHLEGLLRLSEYQRLHGQHEAAASTLRRAMFVIESAWHPSFAPWEVPCRMAPPVPRNTSSSAAAAAAPSTPTSRTNDALWSTWRSSMFAAGRAGTPRVALELGKLLLQLCPTGPSADPLRVLLALDAFAVMCGNADAATFLLNLTGGVDARGEAVPCAGAPAALCGESGERPSLAHAAITPMLTLRGSVAPIAVLPNLAFSRALALFHLEAAALRTSPKQSSGYPFTTAVASVQRGDAAAAAAVPTTVPVAPSGSAAAAAASQLLCADLSFLHYNATRSLVRALLMYPHVLHPLTRGAGVGPHSRISGGGGGPQYHPASSLHTGAAVWSNVLSAPLFAYADRSYRRCCDSSGSDASRRRLDDDDYDDEEGDEEAVEVRGNCTHELAKLVRVMLARQAPLWKDPAVISWLFSAASIAASAAAAADSAEGDAPANSSAVRFFGSRELAAAEAFTAAEVRQELFLASSSGGRAAVQSDERRALASAIRHYGGVVVSDFSDELVTLGAGALADEDAAGQRGAGVAARPPGIWLPGQQRERELDLRGTNLLLLFVDSLLPWTTIPGAPRVTGPPV